MGITLDTIREDLHAIAIKDSANGYELSIDSNGKITSIIEDGGGSITIDGTVAATQSGTWNIGTVASITADVSIDDGGNSITVDATNLDIRDLTSVSDNVEIKTAGGQALAIDGSGYITANQGTSPWVVSATDLDIRDLDYTQDNVAIKDSDGDELEINADGSINVIGALEVTPAGYDTWKVTAETVTNSESELVSTPLAGRLNIIIQNLGTQDCYLKNVTGVSTANGLKLNKGSSFEQALDDGADIFAITASGSTDLRVAEFSA